MSESNKTIQAGGSTDKQLGQVIAIIFLLPVLGLIIVGIAYLLVRSDKKKEQSK